MTTDRKVAFEESVSIVVFGASGDLASKKTFPALFALFSKGLLPKKTRIYGYARSEMSKEEFSKKQTFHIKSADEQADKIKEFTSLSTYVRGGYDDDKDFRQLNSVIEEGEKNMPEKNRLFYLALPPSQFADVGEHIKKECYLKEDEGRIRVIIEKPFGRDLKSSRELQAQLSPIFSEVELYRIDHYLGKEVVKNLMKVRFLNTVMMSFWDNRFISNVSIVFKEPFGTEKRGGYFDDVGIIRDVMQNHLVQVLCLLTMSRPVSTSPEDIRDEKVKVLRAVRPVDAKDVILGQYVAAEVNGEKKPGYKDDDTIENKDTKTPTFAAIPLYIENDRWDGVPFVLKAGKALNEAKVEIVMQFKPVPGALRDHIPPNELIFRIQPDEAILLKMNTKYPGLNDKLVVDDLDISYRDSFPKVAIPEAYESLILDCLKGDHSNFVRDDELDEAWKIFTPILERIDAGDVKVHDYKYGSEGPEVMKEFMQSKGFIDDI